MTIKIAVVQFNPTVGDIEHNKARILALYAEAQCNHADIVVFPESALAGYPLEDLVLRKSFMRDVTFAADELVVNVQEGNNTATLVFGTPYINGQAVHNSVVMVDPVDHATHVRHKRELPNYGVFDEKRTFTASHDNRPIQWRGCRLGLMICEDTWFSRITNQLNDDSCRHLGGPIDLFVSINGSPFEVGKNIVRHKVVQERVSQHVNAESSKSPPINRPFLYVNAVGGQDELVFDGGSFLLGSKGRYDFPEFQEGIFYVEHDMQDYELARLPAQPVDPTGVQQIYQALVLGTRDYLRKQSFESVVLGYSGGVDSGLVAAIACDALGPNLVNLVRLPSKFSSSHSLSDAAQGAQRLGANLRTIEIEGVVQSLRSAYSDWMTVDQTTSNAVNHFNKLEGVADENIQARARGTILMAISNQEDCMVLTTGNKSECSVGYCTLYGDMDGGYNPIKDCYKTTVWDLCRWRNALTQQQLTHMGFLGKATEVVPEAIISKPPSAELAENQLDSNSLPPYPVLDAILKEMIENEQSKQDIVAKGFDADVVKRVRSLVDRAEYKRRQAAPGVKITSKLHGRDRRYPIVNKWGF